MRRPNIQHPWLMCGFILSRCVKHESHPMNHDFKVEFNYSWLAPPVDDYLKV